MENGHLHNHSHMKAKKRRTVDWLREATLTDLVVTMLGKQLHLNIYIKKQQNTTLRCIQRLTGRN